MISYKVYLCLKSLLLISYLCTKVEKCYWKMNVSDDAFLYFFPPKV